MLKFVVILLKCNEFSNNLMSLAENVAVFPE